MQAIFNILPFARAYGAKLTPDVLLRHGEKPRQIDFHWRSVAALFCEQNFRAEITQGKVCKCKWLHISRLTMSSGTVCNKKAQKREQMGTFCMVSAVNSHGLSRRNHPQRCHLPSPKGIFEDTKGHKRHHQRPSLARQKTTKGFAGSCFAPGSRHFPVDTLSSFHVIVIAF